MTRPTRPRDPNQLAKVLMRSNRAWISNFVAAACLPFLVCGAFVLLLTSVADSIPWVIVSSVAATLGFLFVVRQLKLWALPLALVYFPLLHVLQLRFALMETCLVFDRCL